MFSDQLQESLAAGAVLGTYMGVERLTREKYLDDIYPHYTTSEVRDATIVGAKAFGAAASGLYAYHLLAGHIPNTTPLWMRTHVET